MQSGAGSISQSPAEEWGHRIPVRRRVQTEPPGAVLGQRRQEQAQAAPSAAGKGCWSVLIGREDWEDSVQQLPFGSTGHDEDVRGLHGILVCIHMTCVNVRILDAKTSSAVRLAVCGYLGGLPATVGASLDSALAVCPASFFFCAIVSLPAIVPQ